MCGVFVFMWRGVYLHATDSFTPLTRQDDDWAPFLRHMLNTRLNISVRQIAVRRDVRRVAGCDHGSSGEASSAPHDATQSRKRSYDEESAGAGLGAEESGTASVALD